VLNLDGMVESLDFVLNRSILVSRRKNEAGRTWKDDRIRESVYIPASELEELCIDICPVSTIETLLVSQELLAVSKK
jgi:hypothetical protein